MEDIEQAVAGNEAADDKKDPAAARIPSAYSPEALDEPARLGVQDNLNTHKPASLYEAFPAGSD